MVLALGSPIVLALVSLHLSGLSGLFGTPRRQRLLVGLICTDALALRPPRAVGRLAKGVAGWPATALVGGVQCCTCDLPCPYAYDTETTLPMELILLMLLMSYSAASSVVPKSFAKLCDKPSFSFVTCAVFFE